MKSIVKKSLLSILSVGALLSSNLMAMENKDFEKLDVFKNIQGKVTGHTLIAKNVDIYLVKGKDGGARPFQVIVDKEGNYLILGSKVLDVKKGKKISIPLDMSILKDNEAFTYGNGKKHYYVFTDPECPFCKRFKSVWPDIKDDVTLHVYFYNLSSHKNANAMTRWVLDGKTDNEKAQRLFKVTNGDKTYLSTKLSDKKIQKYNETIKKQFSLGTTLGVQGVPAVFDTKGEAIAWPTLKPKK